MKRGAPVHHRPPLSPSRSTHSLGSTSWCPRKYYARSRGIHFLDFAQTDMHSQKIGGDAHSMASRGEARSLRQVKQRRRRDVRVGNPINPCKHSCFAFVGSAETKVSQSEWQARDKQCPCARTDTRRITSKNPQGVAGRAVKRGAPVHHRPPLSPSRSTHSLGSTSWCPRKYYARSRGIHFLDFAQKDMRSQKIGGDAHSMASRGEARSLRQVKQRRRRDVRV